MGGQSGQLFLPLGVEPRHDRRLPGLVRRGELFHQAYFFRVGAQEHRLNAVAERAQVLPPEFDAQELPGVKALRGFVEGGRRPVAGALGQRISIFIDRGADIGIVQPRQTVAKSLFELALQGRWVDLPVAAPINPTLAYSLLNYYLPEQKIQQY